MQRTPRKVIANKLKRQFTPKRPHQEISPTELSAESTPRPSAKKRNQSTATMTTMSDDMKKAFEGLTAQLTAMQAQLTNIQSAVTTVTKDTAELQDEVEMMRKQMLSKTVIIYGMPDSASETVQQTECKVETLTVKIGISDLDYDNIRRMGRFKEGKQRPIELSFLRTKDKIELLRAKNQLRNMDEYKNLFINNAKTRKEMDIQKKLMEYAKTCKLTNPLVKYRFRNNVMELTKDGKSTYYTVNKEGTIEEKGTIGAVVITSPSGSQGVKGGLPGSQFFR